MTAIVIHEFGGMQPRIGDQYLATEAASDAENCLLLSGELRPLHAPSLLNIFYPGNSHQRNTDLFQPELGRPDEGSYDEYLSTTFGDDFEVWIKGINGLVDDSVNGAPLSGAFKSFTGIDPFEEQGTPIMFAGASLNSDGGRGNNMQHIPVPADQYQPENPSRGNLSIDATVGAVPKIILQGLPDAASFDEKVSVGIDTGSRNYIQYRCFADVTGLTVGGDGNASCTILSGTITPVASASLNTVGEDISEDVLFTPGLEGGSTSWRTVFRHSPSEQLGTETRSDYELSITGHPGTVWGWNNIYTSFTNYTLHMLFRWQENTSGAQVFFATGRGTQATSGLAIYYLFGNLVVAHGDNDRATLGAMNLVAGQTYQLIVTHTGSGEVLDAYLNGVSLGQVTNFNRWFNGTGAFATRVGSHRIVTSGNPFSSNSIFPLWGEWQHLWFMPRSVSPTEVADLYAAFQAGELP